jgi:hypothetical protein
LLIEIITGKDFILVQNQFSETISGQNTVSSLFEYLNYMRYDKNKLHHRVPAHCPK